MDSDQGAGVVKKSTAEDDDMKGAAQMKENPLSPVIGGLADDPLWDEFIEEMERSRQELDQTLRLIV